MTDIMQPYSSEYNYWNSWGLSCCLSSLSYLFPKHFVLLKSAEDELELASQHLYSVIIITSELIIFAMIAVFHGEK